MISAEADAAPMTGRPSGVDGRCKGNCLRPGRLNGQKCDILFIAVHGTENLAGRIERNQADGYAKTASQLKRKVYGHACRIASRRAFSCQYRISYIDRSPNNAAGCQL
jgi:hypothetical protein